ncbi:hypothetical protein N7456_010558 [Penicillium angulare]|uniref:Nephrocystin 3-like N-terminal domain-containing protein n=1 Tax=Penicillium angulare TaxID=116970 RepID=A0A9W9K768_9EURO|nr:hypothetical protein N7456_010558 [Penicillium angulare]
MALALRRAAHLKPEIRLAQAVSEFESKLSREEKARFNTRRSQSLASPPTVQDVRLFTAEIDRDHGGRCLATRFMSVVESVQKFAAIGDILIGGSQNLIACGVWSVVRLSLSLISKSYSQAERLSEIFVNVGRYAPRLEKMAALFYHSRDLQLAVSEYFIVVVRVCSDMLQFTKMSTLKRVASSVSDKSLIEYQMDLQSWGEVIRDELQVERAKKGQQEEAANARSRNILGELFQSSSNQQKLRAKQQILDFCSQFEYMNTWKKSRREGNTTLFRNCPSYKAWKSDKSCSTLVYTGKIGVGKSVMFANMVDDLQIPLNDEKRVVTFFFIRHDAAETLTARAIIGSVAQQLLSQLVDAKTDGNLFKAMCELFQTTTYIDDYERMKKLLSLVLHPQKKTFAVVDGIDELSSIEMGVFFKELESLQRSLGISVCISTRQDASHAIKGSWKTLQNRVVAKFPDNTTEIKNYIREEINRCLLSEELIIKDRDLISEINNALHRGSQGMFLWVSLLIQFLCGMHTDKEIRKALDDLPQDLSETYSRILKKSNKSDGPYQMLILQMILVAQRQMMIGELQVAISVSPGDINWDSSQLISNIFSTLKSCGGLVTVDEEELTVHFVHHSFKQYLNKLSRSSEHSTISLHGAHRLMANTIITYLSYSVFEKQISSQTVPVVHARSAVSGIIQSARSQAGWMGDVAVDLLQRKEKHALRMNIGKTLAEVRLASSSATQELAFSDYATRFWSAHLAESFPTPPDISLLLQKLCDRRFFSAEKSQGMHILFGKAAKFNQVFLIQYLAEVMSVDVNCTVNSTGSTALHVACYFGQYETVKYLVYVDGINPMVLDSRGNTPARVAYDEKNLQLLEVFFDAGALNNSPDILELTFRFACTSGHEIVAKMFHALQNGQVTLDLNASGNDHKTPLHLAIENGHENIAKNLLSLSGVDASCIDIHGQTPLILAMRRENEALFEMLVNLPEVDVNRPDPRDGKSPLQKALLLKNETVMTHILRHPRSRLPIFDHSLFAECISWAIDEYRDFLFAAFINHPDAKKNFGVIYPGVLNLVMGYGHIGPLQILLSHSAIDEAFHSPFQSPILERSILNATKTMLHVFFDHYLFNPHISEYLHSAIKFDRMDIMEILMAYPTIDINLADLQGYTPLHNAVLRGNTGMVDILLDRQDMANNFKVPLHNTPLGIAITSHGVSMVKRLLEYHAKNGIQIMDVAGPTLEFAIEAGDPNFVAFIIGHFGTKVFQLNVRYNFLHVALKIGQLATAKILITDLPRSATLRDHRGRSALHCAIQAPWNRRVDRLEIIRSLILLFPSLLSSRDNENNTSLHLAAQMDLYDVLKFLIPSTRQLLSAPNAKAETPLHLAASSAGEKSILTLLAYGAKTDIADNNGLTPLDIAISAGNDDASHLLRRYSACLQAEDIVQGKLTPLHCAARLGDVGIGRILLKEYPHLLNCRDNAGMNPLDTSVFHGRTEFSLMIRRSAGSVTTYLE